MRVASWLKLAIFAFPMGIFGEQTYLLAGKEALKNNPNTRKSLYYKSPYGSPRALKHPLKPKP